MLLQILAILAPAFLCVLAGFLWTRNQRTLDTRQIAQLVTEIGCPALILATIPSLTLDRQTLLQFTGCALTAVGFTGLIAFALLRCLHLPVRNFLPPLIFGNHGNMGLSLSLFAFGEQGLALSLIFFTLTTLLYFTVGISVMDRNFSVMRHLRSPLVFAMAFSIVLLATHTTLPAWLFQTVQLLGNIAIPLMLLALGVSLATLGYTQSKTGLQLTALRFAAGLGGGLLAAQLFGLNDVARGVLLLQSAMPAAVFSYLLAEHYQRSPAAIAGYVVSSTVIAIPLLGVLLWWLRS